MKKKTKHRGKQIRNWLKHHLYQIVYFIMLIALWLYIGLNWEKCVSMQFFSQFDGNNILFLVGILLMVLPFYEVEGGGIKIRKAGEKELEKDLESEESKYQDKVIQNVMITMQTQNTQRKTGVMENDELSR